MNEIKIFENPEFGEMEPVIIDGDPYFKAIDVCKCLGYTKPHSAIKRHVRPEDSLFHGTPSKGGEQQTLFINESGLYTLILRSKRKEAVSFQHWVTSDLLPTLRKTGRYELEQQALAIEIHNKHLIHRVKEAEKDATLSKELLCMGAELDVRSKVSDVVLYSASEIAKELGYSTQFLNKRLAEMGIIEKEYGIWMIVDRYKPYGYAKLDEKSYKDRYRGSRQTVQLMKWTIEGVKFIISMWTGMEDNQVNESVILSNLIHKKKLHLIAKQQKK